MITQIRSLRNLEETRERERQSSRLRRASDEHVWEASVVILKQRAILGIFGVGVGLIAAFALTRVIGRLVYQISASDPWAFIAVAFALIAITLVACNIAARRCLRLEP